MNNLWHFLIGSPLPTQQMAHEKLNKLRALAAFSPDALSSIAYANQEIYLGLLAAGAVGLSYSWSIALAIAVLMAIVAVSYLQTIPAYPNGGGSYTVAKENLGATVGLVTASALMIDYVLTASVSLTAGVAAIASAFPQLWEARVPIALVILVIITLANLRGMRESGSLMAVPVYLFIVGYVVLIGVGIVRAIVEGPGNLVTATPAATVPLTLFLVLHTFASGCTALTGIEVISNGVPSFTPPEVKNARVTMVVMAFLMAGLFLGSIGLTQYFGVVAAPNETILSALASRVLGNGLFYYVIQISTLLILSVAANSSFAGFPRLASVLAGDRYLPNQFAHLGDRLVYSNGIMVLAVFAGALIVLFNDDSHSLIPLFAVGVFLAFTLSQIGMVKHWVRERKRGWLLNALINGLGGMVTLLALGVIAFSKFLEGAWLVIFLIPLLTVVFRKIKTHYQEVAAELTLRGLPPSLKPVAAPRVVIPISGMHRGTIEALRYARAISHNIQAVYVETDAERTAKLRRDWEIWGQDVPLVVINSPYRSLVQPFVGYLYENDHAVNDGRLATVIVPEFVPVRWWHHLLHNQTATILRLALLYDRRKWGYNRVIIDVPFHLRK